MDNLSSLDNYSDSWEIAQFFNQPNLQNSFTETNALLKQNNKINFYFKFVVFVGITIIIIIIINEIKARAALWWINVPSPQLRNML